MTFDNTLPALQSRRLSLPFLGPLLGAFIDVLEPALMSVSRSKRIVAMELENDDFAFYRIAGRNTTLLGNGSALADKERRILLSAGKSDIELRLHPDKVILATLKVPADGLAYAPQIVESRLDRLTPWKPEKLLYGFALDAKPGEDGQTVLDFAATSREIGADSLRRLAAFGLSPSRMGSMSGPVEERARIDLLRGQNDTVRLARRKRVATIALAIPVICLLAFATSALFAMLSAQHLAELDGELTTTRRLLVEGSGSGADRQRNAALIAAKTPDHAQFVLIDRLATILPDTTVLDELDIQENSVRIAGTSTEATALIEVLESEPALSDAKFAAPVTRQDDGRDRFDITAARAGPAKEVAP